MDRIEKVEYLNARKKLDEFMLKNSTQDDEDFKTFNLTKDNYEEYQSLHLLVKEKHNALTKAIMKTHHEWLNKAKLLKNYNAYHEAEKSFQEHFSNWSFSNDEDITKHYLALKEKLGDREITENDLTPELKVLMEKQNKAMEEYKDISNKLETNLIEKRKLLDEEFNKIYGIDNK